MFLFIITLELLTFIITCFAEYTQLFFLTMVFTPVNVEKEYEKDKNLKREDVATLMEWASKTPHLPKITELQAIQFLHSCFYRIEPAKVTIENFFTIYTMDKDLFIQNLDDQKMNDVLKCVVLTILPKSTVESHRILYGRLTDTDSNLYSFDSELALASMITMLDLNLNGTCPGYISIIDGEGAHLGHMAKVNINILKKFLFLLQEGAPIRLIGFHVINYPSWLENIFVLVRPFVKKEIFEMLHFHSNIEALCEYVPKECLPEDLGGESPTFLELQQNTNELLKNNFDLFRELGTQTVDESKKQAKFKNELFGIDGSFKKLEFD